VRPRPGIQFLLDRAASFLAAEGALPGHMLHLSAEGVEPDATVFIEGDGLTIIDALGTLAGAAAGKGHPLVWCAIVSDTYMACAPKGHPVTDLRALLGRDIERGNLAQLFSEGHPFVHEALLVFAADPWSMDQTVRPYVRNDDGTVTWREDLVPAIDPASAMGGEIPDGVRAIFDAYGAK
jgi:hypothetical protein